MTPTGTNGSGRRLYSKKDKPRGDGRTNPLRGDGRVSAIDGRLRLIRGRRAGRNYHLLVDSGASINLIKQHVLTPSDRIEKTNQTIRNGK